MKKESVYLAVTALLIMLAGSAGAQVCKKKMGSGYDPLKMPFFGDLHSHTSWSFDAVTIGNATTPEQAFNFAKGQPIALPFSEGNPRGDKQLERPLDFLAVTDHSEYFGEVQTCLPCGPDVETCGEALPDHDACVSMQETVIDGEGSAFVLWALPVVSPFANRFPYCQEDPVGCTVATASVWQDVQDNANQANVDCQFTAFIGYEWSSQPAGYNHHRNVIFKNGDVPPIPFSVFETGGAGYDLPNDGPPKLWELLDTYCVNNQLRGPNWDCDALAIPHNANLGAGSIMPIFPESSDYAFEDHRTRQRRFERLMEIHQAKGNSECRMNVGNTDEDCQFELLSKVWLLEPGPGAPRAKGPVDHTAQSVTTYLAAEDQGFFSNPEPPGTQIFQTSRPTETGGTYNTFQREILKGGLWLAQDSAYNGLNPYKLGAVGGTDTHSSLPGATEEEDWDGHHGVEDETPELRLALGVDVGSADDDDPKHTFLEMNPGGLTVVWATENTRDAIFSSLKERETYATSGNRPTVRFFGTTSSSAFDENAMCASDADFARIGYTGTSMGGTLTGSAKPIFAVRANRDPRTDLAGGLQRLQIIKGWIDAQGNPQEQVFTIDDDGQSMPLDAAHYLDPASCEITPDTGSDTLCAVWPDDTYVPGQDAFYYVRVLEAPTCRWSTRQCMEMAGGNSGHPCWEALKTPGATAFDNDGNPTEALGLIVEKTIQERAWTSPIWLESGSTSSRGKGR